MGWSFRKSYKAGPIRINISKSGIGYSVGTKGFRIGNGPRGRYVRMGAHGIYYYAKLKDPSNDNSSTNNNQNTSIQYSDEEKMDSLNTTNQPENVDLEVFTDAYNIGLAQILNNQMDFCLKLEKQYKEQKGLIIKKRMAQVKKQNDLMEREKKKYWGWNAFNYGLLISLVLFPLLFIFVPYSIYYYKFRKRKLEKKEREIERKDKPFFDNLYHLENELRKKYWAIKDNHKLLFNFDEKQLDFLAKIRLLFSQSPQKGSLVLLYRKPTTKSYINNQYDIFKNINFGEVVLSNLLLEEPIPSIVIENRILLFFPQALIVEENQRFNQIPYSNLKIVPYSEKMVLKSRPDEDDLIEQEVWEHARVDGTQDRRYKSNRCFYVIRYFGIKFVNKEHLCIPIYFSSEESSRVFMSTLKSIISYK